MNWFLDRLAVLAHVWKMTFPPKPVVIEEPDVDPNSE